MSLNCCGSEFQILAAVERKDLHVIPYLTIPTCGTSSFLWMFSLLLKELIFEFY